MKSIKPGRGPSMMGVIVGIAVAVFGVLWTIGAASITTDMGGMFAPDPFEQTMSVIFPLFGVVYKDKSATGKNR